MRIFWRAIAILVLLLGIVGGQTDTVFSRTQVAVKEGVLLAAFGTSVPEARVSFKALEEAFRKTLPETPIVWTYTSQIIRKKLQKRGEHIPGIAEALQMLSKEGVNVLRVQPLHVMAGEEYSSLERAVLLAVQKHPKRFQAVYFGRPLLESREDAQVVGKAILDHAATIRKPGEALVLMGHGQEHGRAGLAFEGVRRVFAELDPLVFAATVEGERTFDDLLLELKKHKVEHVLLMPLMLVAGDHARNDLAGDEEDSWKSKLAAQGFSVRASLEGLGSYPEVEGLYLRHARESRDDLIKEPRKQ